MKKVFSLAIAALLAMSFTFTSCSKDDDDIVTPDSLSETTWAVRLGDNSLTLSFRTEILYELSTSGPDLGDLEGMGFYTYSKPNLTLTLGMGDSAETIHGVVNGDKLKLTIEGEEITLTKK
jgi:hypothetical protein